MYLNKCFSVFRYSIPWKCTIKFFMVILPGAPRLGGPPSLDTRTPARYATVGTGVFSPSNSSINVSTPLPMAISSSLLIYPYTSPDYHLINIYTELAPKLSATASVAQWQSTGLVIGLGCRNRIRVHFCNPVVQQLRSSTGLQDKKTQLFTYGCVAIVQLLHDDYNHMRTRAILTMAEPSETFQEVSRFKKPDLKYKYDKNTLRMHRGGQILWRLLVGQFCNDNCAMIGSFDC